MKCFIFLLSFVCFATLSLEAQTLSYAEDAEMSRELQKMLNGGRSDGCSNTFLIIPPDPNKPGFKKDLPLGVDLKPLLQSYITNGSKKFLLSGVGDAIGCDAFCASQALTDWHLRGQLFGWDVVWGRLDTITAKQPGKYIVVGYTQEGCAVVETFVVACAGTGTSNIVSQKLDITIYFEPVTTGTINNSNDVELIVRPNPVQETLNIDLKGQYGNVSMTIIAMDGKIIVSNQKLNAVNAVDVRNYTPGMYSIMFSTDGKTKKQINFVKSN